jgi:8-oxo-dGTP pyrophosphatase MutT (NUDIX family)
MSLTETEPDLDERHHPYRRPVDAATLILLDRTGSRPKVLLGKRHDKIVFMPGKFVFPGGRVDKTDNRVPVASPLPPALEANLLKGSPKITASRARALAVAAIREACEETGLCLGRKNAGDTSSLEGVWKPFADEGMLPDPSGLFLVARAITPPGLVRRFDTRFFATDFSAVTHRVEGIIHADAELVELKWIEVGSALPEDLHFVTKRVMRELENHLTAGPLRHDVPIPFFHAYNGKRRRDVLGVTA